MAPLSGRGEHASIDGVNVMTRNMTKIVTLGMAALLVAALVLPAAAFAAPGNTGGSGGSGIAGSATAAGDPLRARVQEALQRRAQRFDGALNTMERRRERIRELAGVVEQAGGDVSQVRAMLQECDALMVQAREQERIATRMFGDVPNAGDRRGSFLQARVQARNAVQTMNQARIQLREAARLLRSIAEGLEWEDDA